MYQNVQPITGSLVATAQLKTIPTNGKGHLHWLYLYNANAAVRYAMVFDKATAPTNGDTPLFMQSMAPTTSVPKELAFSPDGLLCFNGIWIAISTTPGTLTLAAAELIFTAGVT